MPRKCRPSLGERAAALGVDPAELEIAEHTADLLAASGSLPPLTYKMLEEAWMEACADNGDHEPTHLHVSPNTFAQIRRSVSSSGATTMQYNSAIILADASVPDGCIRWVDMRRCALHGLSAGRGGRVNLYV